MNYALEVSRHTEALSNNYVLLFTSNSIEKEAVNTSLNNTLRVNIDLDTSGCTLGLLSNRFVLHICGESGFSKERSIGRIASGLLHNPTFPRPALILLVGFCWGNLKKVNDNSIIAATEICILNEKREKRDGATYVPRRVKSPIEISSSLTEEINSKLIPQKTHLVTGAMASLETRYESDEARDALLADYPDLLGGEMEAFALVPSCKTLPWLVLKSVSDSGGNDFETTGQKDAAMRASNAIKCLLDTLPMDGTISEIKSGNAQDLLTDILSGDTIHFEAKSTTAEGLNDYLDEVLGTRIEYKLRAYGSELEYGSKFALSFCDLLLELIQNTVRYGRATRASVKFTPSKIVFHDDGKHFSPLSLTGSKGGARAWQNAVKLFKADEMISVKHTDGGKGNTYTFSLGKVDRLLGEARRNCLIRINPNSIGTIYGAPEVIEFDDRCEALYFDASTMRMMSRRLSLLEALRPLIKSGKKIFVACRSQDDVLFFQDELRELNGSHLVIFVKSD